MRINHEKKKKKYSTVRYCKRGGIFILRASYPTIFSRSTVEDVSGFLFNIPREIGEIIWKKMQTTDALSNWKWLLSAVWICQERNVVYIYILKKYFQKNRRFSLWFHKVNTAVNIFNKKFHYHRTSTISGMLVTPYFPFSNYITWLQSNDYSSL